MKTVMSNWEVADKWGEQKEGRNSKNTFSFEGPDLYSYRTKVGHICENGIRIVTAEKYSCTTSQQLANVKKDFEVLFLDDTKEAHEGNVKYFLHMMKKTVMQFSNCRSRTGRWIIAHNNELYRKLVAYCKTFGLKVPVTLGLYLDPEFEFVKKFEERFYKHGPNGWREIFLPKWLAKKGMENVDVKDLLKTRNAEIRREIIRLIGIEKVCEGLGAKVIDKQDGYELILLDLRDGRRRPFLKMRNPSVGEWHIEGVHPCVKTVQDALNYRRYGENMLEVIVPNEIQSWRDKRIYRSNPENWSIREEYKTSQLFPNERDWRPVRLT
uniref:Uncharacterized protein n=1 Tax=viral metagenome TaxID=1070528 RepID=A0A6M3JH38_9ZZZZ